MGSKGPASVRSNGKRIVHNGAKHEGVLPGAGTGAFDALQSNIQESLDEIEILRGTLNIGKAGGPPPIRGSASC